MPSAGLGAGWRWLSAGLAQAWRGRAGRLPAHAGLDPLGLARRAASRAARPSRALAVNCPPVSSP